jgi:hypothetical protein
MKFENMQISIYIQISISARGYVFGTPLSKILDPPLNGETEGCQKKRRDEPTNKTTNKNKVTSRNPLYSLASPAGNSGNQEEVRKWASCGKKIKD